MEDIVGTINYIKDVVERIEDRLIAVESKISGIHVRVDNETIRTKNLENRIRAVLPDLPPAPSMP